ncbi:glycerophosphodiester phosphodiesterase [Halobacteriales archaeon QS_5_70_17]|jgi:glycerophosphoryl diester phosphodiesterase|nr:MAG: glycerophosphodiester phosphodiesterase [Halobacteriales archaeon QS_5_70_17]
MRCIGHRGCAARAPENTVRAVELAAPHVDMVEVDVRRCGSGELVVSHDERLGRLTDGAGRVDETPHARLRELRVENSDERIPLLSDLLAAVPAEVGINVELKHAGIAGDLLAILDDADNDVVLSSFDEDALAEVGARGEYPLGYLFHRSIRRLGRNWRHALEAARNLDCAYLHPEYRLCLGRPERVERAHAAGFEVNAWTVKRARTVERLRAVGVDGVIVDDWEIV